MEPKVNNGNMSGVITNTRDIGIPSTEPVNGHGMVSTVPCPT